MSVCDTYDSSHPMQNLDRKKVQYKGANGTIFPLPVLSDCWSFIYFGKVNW